ncbi:hypothetical protein GGX14DRAFT_442763 [Mycena pura]|uniref:Uncharacterized protein n=1 Tax=Mycena pura TaxID=153505 RepID=A0AAD6VPD8_9AGAR|nr:hypothetical protein GGX14DRAFT_442763 [Mycena pura]
MRVAGSVAVVLSVSLSVSAAAFGGSVCPTVTGSALPNSSVPASSASAASSAGSSASQVPSSVGSSLSQSASASLSVSSAAASITGSSASDVPSSVTSAASGSASGSISASAPLSSDDPFVSSSISSTISMSAVPTTPEWTDPDPTPTSYPPKPSDLPPFDNKTDPAVEDPDDVFRRSRIFPRSQLMPRVVSATQYHATCRTDAAAIQRRIAGQRFQLLTRNWPDEFSWNGGFYLTPDRTSAELFGAIFRAEACVNKGGVVVIQFTLNTNVLNINEVPNAEADDFRAMQKAIGTVMKNAAIKYFGGAPQWRTPLPTSDQLSQVFNSALLNNDQKAAIVDIFPRDAISTSAGFIDSQVPKMQAATANAGIPSIPQPFPQVVLRTDVAMEQLAWVGQTDLDATLTAQVATWLAYLQWRQGQGFPF